MALTRASHKLYLPYLSNPKLRPNPLTTFIRDALTTVKLPGLIKWQRAGSKVAPAPGAEAEESESLPLPEPLLPDLPRDLAKRRLLVASFTSLHDYEARQRHPLEQAVDFMGQGTWKDDEEAGGQASEEVEEDGLPAGPHVGSMFHDLLERVDYAWIGATGEAAELLEAGTVTAEAIDDRLAH